MNFSSVAINVSIVPYQRLKFIELASERQSSIAIEDRKQTERYRTTVLRAENMSEAGSEADGILAGCSMVDESPCESVVHSDQPRKTFTAPQSPVMLPTPKERVGRSNKSGSACGVSVHCKASAFLPRSDSACSSNILDVTIFEAQRNRQFRKLQKQKDIHLADLWNILCNFKDLLKVEGNNRFIAGTCKYHIAILEHMLAPMMADEHQLSGWLSQQTVDRLEKQIMRYLQRFKGNKFKAVFQEQLASRAVQKSEGEAAGPVRERFEVDHEACLGKEQKKKLEIDLNAVPLDNSLDSDIVHAPLDSVTLPTREILGTKRNEEESSPRYFVAGNSPSKRMCEKKTFCTEKESMHAQERRQKGGISTSKLSLCAHGLESANPYSFATKMNVQSEQSIAQKGAGVVESKLVQPVQLSMSGRCGVPFRKEDHPSCPADMHSRGSLKAAGACENLAKKDRLPAKSIVSCIPDKSNTSGDFDVHFLGNRADWGGATHSSVEEKLGATVKDPSLHFRGGFPKEDQHHATVCMRRILTIRNLLTTHLDGLRKRNVEEMSRTRKCSERESRKAQLVYIESNTLRRRGKSACQSAEALFSRYGNASDHSLPS